MLHLPSDHEKIIKDIDRLNLPNNNFNPYMSAPQQFRDDHQAIKADLCLAISKSRIKIITMAALAIMLIATASLANPAPATPVTCEALIKQFDIKAKFAKPTEQGQQLRLQAEQDQKAKDEESCFKNIQAAIKTLGK